MNKALKPLGWISGTWRSLTAVVNFPSMKPEHYCEELSFKLLDGPEQPVLKYTCQTWNPETKAPMHLENGFLRIAPDGRTLMLLTAQKFGCTTVEEGSVDGQTISLRSVHIGLGSLSPFAFTELQRKYKLNEDGKLEYEAFMATPRVKLTQHISAVFEKIQ